jgi:hypothetical protein
MRLFAWLINLLLVFRLFIILLFGIPIVLVLLVVFGLLLGLLLEPIPPSDHGIVGVQGRGIIILLLFGLILLLLLVFFAGEIVLLGPILLLGLELLDIGGDLLLELLEPVFELRVVFAIGHVELFLLGEGVHEVD